MTTRTTIYQRCPGCGKDALVGRVQDTHRCAACNFDYGTLARDSAAREAWMLQNLRVGGFFTLYVVYLNHQVTGVTQEESRRQVEALARAHGIPLPTGRFPFPWKFVAVALGFLALLAAVAILVARVAR